jgi:outer membrane immunogenic protein
MRFAYAAAALAACAAGWPVRAEADDWTGLYAGVHAGASFQTSETPGFFSEGGPIGQTLLLSGFAANPAASLPADRAFNGGLQLGANARFGSFVVGLEGDLAFGAISASDATTTESADFGPFNPIKIFTTTVKRDIDGLGTLRARAGYLITPAVLLYGTAGLAIARSDASFDYANTGSSGYSAVTFGSDISCPAQQSCLHGTSKDVLTGFAAGGGFEFALAEKLSIKGEYLFIDLESQTVRAYGTPLTATPDVFLGTRIDPDIHLLRFGLNLALD